MSIPLLQMEDITKVYPGTVANNAVSFAVDAGEIHALVGENGTGKTTLMRVLYGMTTPDRGVIRWRGRPVQIGSSQDAIALGIGMVHQHFMLVSSFTVAENVVLGLREGFPLLNLDAAARRLHRLSDQSVHRGATARRNPQGSLLGSRAADPGRADRHPGAERGGGAVRRAARPAGAGARRRHHHP
jgi:ABC-type sugar transport system ATPase subunit